MNGPAPGLSTINEADLNRRYLAVIAVAAALGGLLFGYDWVVIGGAAKFYEPFFRLHDTSGIASPGASLWARLLAEAFSPTGWAQSCALLGCLGGALASGAFADRFGRKPVLIAAAANFVISSLGIAYVESFQAFVAWRILGGVSIGLASNVSPMYISEIAPSRHRGLLVAVNQLTIVFGVLAAQWINWRIARPVPPNMSPEAFAASWNVMTGWRWMFGACAVPSLLFFVSAVLLPESPRWLIKAGRVGDAGRILERIGGKDYASVASREISATLENNAQRLRLSELLGPGIRASLVLGIFLAVFQQWCGINVIFNYAGEIFKQAGYDLNDTLTNIVMTGVVNLVFTFVALFTVDRLGRRPLMLFGAAALTLIYAVLGYCYHLRNDGATIHNAAFLILVLSAIGSYAMSLAPVTWVIVSEIFPNRIRGTAMSIAVGFLWIACFLLTYSFPIINARLGPAGTFWIYSGICACGLLFILLRLPETRGRSLEQIERDSGV